MSKYQNIINQCDIAIRSIKSILSPDEFQECMNYIHQYNEWLIALELAIDWLVEDDRKITEESYRRFKAAYQLMALESDIRLQYLKSQIVDLDL